jgi:hypothetical protein
MAQKQLVAVICGIPFTSIVAEEEKLNGSIQWLSDNGVFVNIVTPQPVTTQPEHAWVSPSMRDALENACKPTGNDLDILPPKVLKDILDHLSLDDIRVSELELRAKARTMSFSEMARAYCAWRGYAANADSLLYVLLQIQKCCQGDSKS